MNNWYYNAWFILFLIIFGLLTFYLLIGIPLLILGVVLYVKKDRYYKALLAGRQLGPDYEMLRRVLTKEQKTQRKLKKLTDRYADAPDGRKREKLRRKIAAKSQALLEYARQLDFWLERINSTVLCAQLDAFDDEPEQHTLAAWKHDKDAADLKCISSRLAACERCLSELQVQEQLMLLAPQIEAAFEPVMTLYQSLPEAQKLPARVALLQSLRAFTAPTRTSVDADQETERLKKLMAKLAKSDE